MASYANGTATVSTVASIIVPAVNTPGGVLIQNQGTNPVYIGGPSVTADATATGGLQVAANATQLIPSVGGAPRDLYAVIASGTAKVAWLSPTWNS